MAGRYMDQPATIKSPNLERSGQTHVQGPILRSIDGASKHSRDSAIQSLIVQSNSIDSDCPLPLLFSVSIYK